MNTSIATETKVKRQMPNWLKYAIIAIPGLIAGIFLYLVGNIPQDPEYHKFIDQRTLYDIPHFGDVISNIGFIISGLLGLIFMVKQNKDRAKERFEFKFEKYLFILFFLGIFLTGFGSTWYHWNPNSETLFWDRLPLTLAFMSIFSIVITERLSKTLGLTSIFPLLLLGAGSVIYWQYSEQAGAGDLRIYAMVQFYPMIAIPLILLFFKSKYNYGYFYWNVMALYGLAKLCELLDIHIFNMNGMISGHNLKHIVASIAPLILILMLKKRKSIPVQETAKLNMKHA